MIGGRKGQAVPGEDLVFHLSIGGGGQTGFLELFNDHGIGVPLSPRILAILFGTLSLGALAVLSPGADSSWKDWAILLLLGGGFVLAVVSVHRVRVSSERIEFESLVGSRVRKMCDLVRLERSRAWFADGSALDLRRYQSPARVFHAIARHRLDLAEGVFSSQELSMDAKSDVPPEIRAWSIAIGVGLGAIALLLVSLKIMMR